MRKRFFPEIITKLPEAEIPIPLKGVKAYLFQGKDQQILFMEFDEEVEIPEHSHAAQWGVVLDGEIEIFMEGKKQVFRKGDTYFVPAGVKHRAKVSRGYKDLSLYDENRFKPKSACNDDR